MNASELKASLSILMNQAEEKIRKLGIQTVYSHPLDDSANLRWTRNKEVGWGLWIDNVRWNDASPELRVLAIGILPEFVDGLREEDEIQANVVAEAILRLKKFIETP